MTYQLEEPFFEDKGKITAQKEIGDNKIQMTFSSNGTIKGNIEVTNSGELVSLFKGNKGTSAQGQEVVTQRTVMKRQIILFYKLERQLLKMISQYYVELGARFGVQTLLAS